MERKWRERKVKWREGKGRERKGKWRERRRKGCGEKEEKRKVSGGNGEERKGKMRKIEENEENSRDGEGSKTYVFKMRRVSRMSLE